MKKRITYNTRSAEETERVGYALADMLAAGGIKKAFIAMRGEMGVGKTAFARGFAFRFGVKNVKSPTYTIVNEYRGEARIFHYDMYRISSSEDLVSTGFDDYVGTEGYVIAEWSENIEDDIPSDAIFVTVSRTDGDSGRLIEVEYEDTCI